MPDENTIQVHGHGEVESAPDIAVINLGVLSREREPGVAMQAASQSMQAVLAAVRGEGIPDHAIQTTQLDLHLDHQANVSMASHQVMVRTEDVARAGAILDAGIRAGANASSGLAFAVANPTELEDQALALAVADARRKADRLAEALGVTIDRVDRVVATGGGVMPMMARRSRAPSDVAFSRAGPPPVEAGQLRITADVQVTYIFR